MATGPQHFALAEQHLEYASGADPDSNQERFNLAAAQIHATLALAAATAELNSQAGPGDWGATGRSDRAMKAWRASGAVDD